MRIGELSRRTGVSVRMLRYYEAEGLLTPKRTAAGYREYGSLDEETVFQIKMLGSAGMTLSTIRVFLPCALDARGEFEPCHELRTIVLQHIERVDERVAELAQGRAALESLLDKLKLP